MAVFFSELGLHMGSWASYFGFDEKSWAMELPKTFMINFLLCLLYLSHKVDVWNRMSYKAGIVFFYLLKNRQGWASEVLGRDGVGSRNVHGCPLVVIR